MRKDITETTKLRAIRPAADRPAHRRRTALPLPADAVDAVFADEGSVDPPKGETGSPPLTYTDVVASVTQQLEQLETQRSQLNKLLEHAAKGLS